MRSFLSDKNTVSLQIAYKKITELYVMTLICLQSLALSLKILLSRSMSSQSLLNCVPCVLKMCPRANLPYVLTCLTCLHATCQHVLCAYVPMCLACFACSRANVPCVLKCLGANVPCVLTCSCVNVPSSITLIHI